jgi:hypothetical protein
LDIDLRKRYLLTGNPNMWEVSMGGSHNINKHGDLDLSSERAPPTDKTENSRLVLF